MNKSESIKELASALALAQSELKNPAFDSNNPHFRSKYASLASVRDTVIPILSKHGLSVAQFPVFSEGRAGCETVLMHKSGEFTSETLLIPCEKQNAHGVGSCITYSRRFSLMAIAGVVGDEDDDGNAAVGKVASTSKAILPSTITPTEGAWDNVPRDRHETLNRIGSAVIDYFEAGQTEDAYEYLEEQKLSAEEKIAVWTLLDSKTRAALKKIGNERRKLAEVA